MRNLILTMTVAIFAAGCSSQAAAPPNVKAPDTFQVTFELSTGPVVVEIERDAGPLGADRFYNLVQAKFFDGARFFRVVPGYIVQFGMAGDPKVHKQWDVNINDDPVKHSNAPGTLVFAATGQPNTRTTQMFFNLGDNGQLDGMGFAPIGRIVSGFENVMKINQEYGERPDQTEIEKSGNQYLEKEFPRLDYIKTVRVLP